MSLRFGAPKIADIDAARERDAQIRLANRPAGSWRATHLQPVSTLNTEPANVPNLSPQSAPLVSVVTPVYNASQTLQRCIESVLAQTYQQWDLSLVDNCSTDGSLDIARAYAAKDSRIRVIENTEFVPVIRSFNRAVSASSPQSKYCKIVAADDFLFPQCLAEMIALAEKHPSIAIVGSYTQRENEVCWDGLPFDQTFFSGKDVCRRRLLGGAYVFGTQSSVMYTSDIVRLRERFYNEANLHCDTEKCYEVLAERDFGFVHQVLSFQQTKGESTRTYSQLMQTYFASQLYDVTRYGKLYLTAQERERRIAVQLSHYYNYLGAQVFHLRRLDFWRHHRRALAWAGYDMSALRVAVAATRQVAQAVLNPLSTAHRIVVNLRGRQRSSAAS
jgi:glycosyltransferase involved in cell wall biosynthesis